MVSFDGMEQEEEKKKKVNDDVVVFMRKRSETEAPRYTARLKTYLDIKEKNQRAAAARRHSEHSFKKALKQTELKKQFTDNLFNIPIEDDKPDNDEEEKSAREQIIGNEMRRGVSMSRGEFDDELCDACRRRSRRRRRRSCRRRRRRSRRRRRRRSRRRRRRRSRRRRRKMRRTGPRKCWQWRPYCPRSRSQRRQPRRIRYRRS